MKTIKNSNTSHPRQRLVMLGVLSAVILSIATMAICAYASVAKEKDNQSIRGAAVAPAPKIVAAYVRSTRDSLPDPNLMTHIYYAFGVFVDTDGNIRIENPERFQKIADLRNENENLKLVLCIGGGPREGFSEMAASSSKRKRFAANCKALVDRYRLAGIDLDWEFPTTTRGGHTASPKDDKNYGRVMKQLRETLGKDCQLSFYSNNGAAYIDYSVMLPYADYVMVSGYNLGRPPKHQSNLYSSARCGDWSVSKDVERHISKGVPASKILLGVPFYALRGGESPNEIDRDRFARYLPGTTEVWDDEAQAPYMADANGEMVASLDNERSLRLKCDYIRDNGLAGVFYWNYDNDDSRHTLARTLRNELMAEK